MVLAWARPGQSGTIGLVKDMRTLSLNVLSAIGFSKFYKFHASEQPRKSRVRSHRESLALILENALVMMLIPPRVFSMPFIPKKWARIGQEMIDFRRYMLDLVCEGQQVASGPGKRKENNLISSLVRASYSEHGAQTKSGGYGTKGLCSNEILSNIFFLTFAGHTTIADTLAHSILLLAAHPGIQEWIGEEIQEVLPHSSDEFLDYDETFPWLKRCQAVLVSRFPA